LICMRQGGLLALPRADSNAQIKDTLKATDHDRVWIGVSDTGREGSWGQPQADGTLGPASDYFHWAPGQPDGMSREGCAEMWTTGEWNDAPCTDSKAYACDVPVPPMDFEFPCSPGLMEKLESSTGGAMDVPRCRFEVHGADGKRPSSTKMEFEPCRKLCEEGILGQLAEPRTASQRQFLARVLRLSGDDSMWVGLTPDKAQEQGWSWLSSESLTDLESSWAYGQPDHDGDCVEMWGDATWNDRACGGDFWANKVCACETLAP